jgi:hypothetical protein
MSNSHTFEEAREDYVRRMGEELGPAYHLLWNECALLHMRWEEYLEMFGSDPRSFEIMNETAPGFFRSVQDLYWESILLGLCRFADKRMVAGKKTLSLETLLTFATGQPVLGLRNLVDDAQAKIKFAQDWRNRRIAHADLVHMLDKPTAPLAPASRRHVREALSSIVAALAAVEMHFTSSGLGFIGTGFRFGGQHLLSQLRVASRLQREHKDRLASGTAREDDFDWMKWRGTL